jgi:hypothetical protein
MLGLAPGIDIFSCRHAPNTFQGVDGRDQPGHDGTEAQ